MRPGLSAKDATEALDWTLRAACLQASAYDLSSEGLGKALANHFAYLAGAAPFVHAGICLLLYIEASSEADNWELLALAGQPPPWRRAAE